MSVALEGFVFPVGINNIKPTYFPSIHQIWIPDIILVESLPLVRAHESMHSCTISLQPPQLIPLSRSLGGNPIKATVRHFEDLMETLCDANLWAQTNLSMEDIPSMIKHAQYPVLMRELFKISHDIISNTQMDTSDEKHMKETVIALCMLLVHIIPHYPQSGKNILAIISDIPVNIDYQDRWQLFRYIHNKIAELWSTKEEVREQLTLAIPMDMHRNIVDMIMFISLVINTVHTTSEAITSAFPALLGILTLGGFELLPLIYINEINGRHQAAIEIIHTTSKQHADPLAYVQARNYNHDEAEELGIKCCAVPICKAIENEAKKHMFLDSSTRSWSCFKALIDYLPHLLNKCLVDNFSCQACKICFSPDGSFENACKTIINISQQTKENLIEAAKNYESFLTTKTMRLIQTHYKLPYLPKAVCHYDFL